MSVLLTWVVSLVALVVEGALLWLVLQNTVTVGWAAAGHGTVLLALGLWVFLCSRAHWDLHIPMLLTITTAVMGLFGALGSVCVLGLLPLFRRHSKSFEEWHSILFPAEIMTSTEALTEHITRTYRDQDSIQPEVTPFVDVLTSGSTDQKLNMISLVVKHFRPILAPVLRMALNDPNNAIRVQAATAMSLIEEEFTKRTLGIEMAAMTKPDHPVTLKTLARHYDNYALTGILDDERERENQNKAIQAYQKYLGFKSDDIEARLAIGRILLKSQSFAEANAWFEKCLKDGFDTFDIILGYMEGLFHAGRFQDLRELARSHYAEMTSADILPAGVVEAIKLWANIDGGEQDKGDRTS